jgi:MoaA/NifB/PqqE/SkfB family radical SAM enzyme
MATLSLNQIRALNVEISSACAARCPFCSRRQKVRPYGNHRITLAEFKMLPDDLIGNLQWINFGGDFGDLCTNPEFPEIVAHVRSLNRAAVIGGDTNGAGQNGAWWSRLGRRLGKGAMDFCIDGLEDTHAIYRVGTDFQKVLRNLRAFTAAGGRAHWKYIVFKHNQHQIEGARELARKAGCQRFYAISSRDYNTEFERPDGFDFRIKRDIFSASVTDESKAVCKPLKNGSIYIAADGSVHPCCFAHAMYITEFNRDFRFILPLIEKNIAAINFKRTPLQEIIAGPYFQKVLQKSRHNQYCTLKCGIDVRKIRSELILHEEYYTDPEESQ